MPIRPFAPAASVALAAALVAALAGAPAATPVAADFPPDSFQNLQVLPKDIGTRELIDTMKAVSMSLGARCPQCHVGQEGQDLSTFDFASDAKPAKKVAREMLRMTQAINDEYLTRVAVLLKEAEPEAAAPEVTCATCHRGKMHPDSSIPPPGGGN
jgi:hypothetical protein